MFDPTSPYAGKVTVYDAPIYIADAAVVLMKTKPELGITNPYALDDTQFAAAVDLLKQQKPMIAQYWVDYTKQMDAFRNGDATVGTTWQVITNLLQGETPAVPVDAIKPTEGATGWSDTWMINSKTKHLNCAYKCIDYIVSPEVNIQVAEWFGEAPGNSKACALAGQPRPLQDLPRRRRGLLEGHLVLADAGGEVRRRPDRHDLQGLRRVGQGLDGDQGLTRPPLNGTDGPSAPGSGHPLTVPWLMTAAPTTAPAPAPTSGRRRLAGGLHRRPRLRLGLLLAGPVGWLVVVYLGSLLILFLNAFWSLDAFTGLVDPPVHARQLRELSSRTRCTGRSRCGRSLMAAAVTVTCAVVAFPIAYYMARVASPRVRGLLVVAVLMPLWASYLVKVYSWRLILAEDGVLELVPRAVRAQGAGLRRGRGCGSCSSTSGCRT